MVLTGDQAGAVNALLYEVDEEGNQELVRSIESTHRAYIRYTNITSRPLVVWWRDFRGMRQFYALLRPGEFCDINTFTTHPWEFTDESTGERYYCGENVIFRAPKRRHDARYRTNWNISVGLRSLRDTALLRVALSVPDVETVKTLGLPQVINEDLQVLVETLQRTRQISRNLD